MVTQYLESKRNEADAVYVETVKAGAGWMHTVKKGQILRIVDINGNQAVDTIFYNADDIYERYSVQQTVQAQRNALVGLGTELRSNDDNVMLKVVADTCGDHDTLGSACSCESNMIRYGFHTRYMHACRETFLAKLKACAPEGVEIMEPVRIGRTDDWENPEDQWEAMAPAATAALAMVGTSQA